MNQRANGFNYGNHVNGGNGLTGDSRAYLSKFGCARQLGHREVTIEKLIGLGYVVQGIDTKCKDFRLLIDEKYLAMKQKKVGREKIVFYFITPKGLDTLGYSNGAGTEDRHQKEKRIESSRHFDSCSRNGFKSKHL